MFKSAYSWFQKASGEWYGLPILCFFFFIESIFFIVPVDPLLIVYCCEHRKNSLLFALLATISSVLGGIVAYFIGSLLWDSVGVLIIKHFASLESFENFANTYKKYESLAVLTAAFTPLPYKVVTLSAGFFKLPFMTFIIYSFIGRGLRFFSIALLITIFGDNIKNFIDRYFNLLVLLFMLLILVSFFLLK